MEQKVDDPQEAGTVVGSTNVRAL
ncbi:uncharacterized protein FFM5_03256 [Fusarium fujikuroi]|nr:uncharacterized protein FFM5_03256 [Fusarium fujikuroi]